MKVKKLDAFCTNFYMLSHPPTEDISFSVLEKYMNRVLNLLQLKVVYLKRIVALYVSGIYEVSDYIKG